MFDPLLPELGCAPDATGAFPEGAELVELEDPLPLGELLGVPASAVAFVLVPFCGTVVPDMGTHVAAGVVAVPFCCVLPGAGVGLDGVVWGFVPGACCCGVVLAPGPAALVVIGVGGPMVVAEGVPVVGGAVAGPGAGAVVRWAGAAAGGGAAVRL